MKLPKGKYVFRNNLNHKGERTLYLQYYIKGKPIFSSSGVTIKPTDWNERTQQVKRTNMHHTGLNNALRLKKQKVDDLILFYEGRITIRILREMLKGVYLAEKDIIEKKLNTDFIQFALELNKRNSDLGKIAYSTFQNDQSSIILFKKYLVLMTTKDVLPVRDISLKLFENYKTYCLGRPNKKESINKKLKPLFKAIKYAADSELIRGDIAAKILNDGYFDLEERRYASVVKDKKIHYLTKHQLQEFSNLYYTVKFARTREFIDIFMFSFYARGLRFSDLLTLEWSHVVWEREEIRKNLYKGNVTTTIPLLPGGTEILRRWQNMEYNTRFVFNLLPENFELHNIAELDKRRKSKNRTLLTPLNELGHKLSSKLPFNLSIHVARHTFAVLAINEGLNLYILSKLLGHRSIKTTEKVYATFLDDKVSDEVGAKINFDFRPQSTDKIII